MTVVSPDAGGVERARAFAKHLNAPLAIIDKRRTDVNVAEVMHIIGDVEGQHCLIVDDLIDTAGTLVKGAEALMRGGRVAASRPALRMRYCRVRRSRGSRIRTIKEVVVTNSIPLREDAAAWLLADQTLSVAPLLAQGDPVHPRGRLRSTLFEWQFSGLF